MIADGLSQPVVCFSLASVALFCCTCAFYDAFGQCRHPPVFLLFYHSILLHLTASHIYMACLTLEFGPLYQKRGIRNEGSAL